MLQFSPGPSEYPPLSVYQNTTEFADLLDVTVDSVLPRPSGAAVLWCVWGWGGVDSVGQDGAAQPAGMSRGSQDTSLPLV